MRGGQNLPPLSSARVKFLMYPLLFSMQQRMLSVMTDASMQHIRRNLSPSLLELPGELFDAGNSLQLVGALLQNRPQVFSGIGSCAKPRSNIPRPEKEQDVAIPVHTVLGRVQ